MNTITELKDLIEMVLGENHPTIRDLNRKVRESYDRELRAYCESQIEPYEDENFNIDDWIETARDDEAFVGLAQDVNKLNYYGINNYETKETEAEMPF